MLALIPFIFTNPWIVAAMNLLITAAVIYAVSYLGGKYLGPDMPETKSGPTADSQSRSWNPHSTQQEGIARPRAYGKNMHHGNIVAKWTDVADDREVLYLVVEHGDGPTKGVVSVDGVKQIFLNDQPATNFTSVETQERLGTFNQTCMTGFEKTKLEYEQNNELKQNVPIIVTTSNDFFDDIEYTIMGPNGLMKYQKDGDRKSSSVGLRVRIRVHPAGGWTTIFNENITGFKLNAWFKNYKVNTLDPGTVVRGTQYDLEVMKTSPDNPERHINDIYFRSFREVVDVAFKRPGKALVGIRAVATESLSGRLDVKVIREDRLVRVWNGTTWSIVYSRNRAWVVYDALTQPVISGDGNGGGPYTVEAYEGFSPAYLDLEFFYNWAEFCSVQVPDGYGGTEDRLACDTILDFHTSVWEFAKELASIGRANLYWSDTLTGWIDTTVAAVSGLVTMDNVMARSWKNAWSEKSELAGKVEVFFNDSRQGYERMPAALPNESAGRYTNIISIEGVGIITRGTAIHVANHALKRNQLIRNINNFRQYKDGFRYKLGDTINIQHKVPDWGSGYRVKNSTANNKVTLDRLCTAVPTDLIFMQVYDAATKKVQVDSYTVSAVSGKVVTIVGTWDVTPKKNYMVAIGADGDIQTRRIIKMDLRSDNYFDITVETYDVALFTADDLVPDLPDQSYIWDRPANPLTRPVTRDEVIELIHQVMAPQSDVDVPVTSNCTWTGSGGDTVTWSKTDATEAIIFRYKGTSYEIEPDSTTDEFIYWDPNFTTTFRTTNDAAVAVVLGKWYMCRNVAGIAYPTVPFSSVHAGVLQAGTITAALGQIANLAVSTLEIQDNAVTVPISTYTEAYVDMVTLTVLQSATIIATGQPIRITTNIFAEYVGNAGRFKLYVYRDDTVIFTQVSEASTGWIDISSGFHTIVLQDTPSAAEHTYYLKGTKTGGAGVARARQRSILLLEVKK